MSTIRDDYPSKINGTDLFRPEKWSVSREVKETQFQTEAGTDQVLIQRTGKTTINAEFACTSAWLATFQGWHRRIPDPHHFRSFSGCSDVDLPEEQ